VAFNIHLAVLGGLNKELPLFFGKAKVKENDNQKKKMKKIVKLLK
jgi:hypothetical protein